jgi:RND family efflux transporter MFP subunit
MRMPAPSALKFVLPPVVLAIGLLATAGLMSTRETVARNPDQGHLQTVEVVRVTEGSPTSRVTATGVVEGDRNVGLSSLVAGEVVHVSKQLKPGGRFRRGQVILKVDPRDYRFAVAKEQASVRQAEVDLALEEQRGRTAEKEWEELGTRGPGEEHGLALRKPQLTAALARLQATEQGLARAELNLKRSVMRAPFAGMVLEQSAERGQLLAPGNPVLTLVGTDRFVVRVALPLADLEHIVLGSDSRHGSAARVIQRLPSRDIERSGWVKQLAGQIDPQSGTATAFVVIDDPLEDEGLPLLPGAFVEVLIEGRTVPGSVRVPRGQVLGGDRVWTVEDGRLQSRAVRVGWADSEHAFITAGLSDGDAIVVTPLSLPVEGAPVRVSESEPSTGTEG